MIGALISMHYIGKKRWYKPLEQSALLFWAAMLIIGITIGYLMINVQIAYLATALGVIIFIALAHYWYKLNWIFSIATWAVAFVIDWFIMYIIIMLFGSSIIWIMGG